MDKNIVMLEGIIGDDYKYGKTQDGKEYATFSLCINSYMKEFADSTERTHSQTYIRIFVFDKKQVAYLQKVKARRGQPTDGRTAQNVTSESSQQHRRTFSISFASMGRGLQPVQASPIAFSAICAAFASNSSAPTIAG